MRKFGLLFCDRCGKKMMGYSPTWIVRGLDGTQEKQLCEACSVELRDEIDGHSKAHYVAMPTELAEIPEEF